MSLINLQSYQMMCTLYSHIWSLKHNFHFNDKLCISNTLIKYAFLAESLTISKTPVLFTILDSALLLLGQIFSKRFAFLLFLSQFHLFKNLYTSATVDLTIAHSGPRMVCIVDNSSGERRLEAGEGICCLIDDFL